MTNEELNTALYKKVFAEQEQYVKCRDELAGASNVAVFDWGGGTLDISLISIENREVSELAVAGMRLGGNDIDQMLARHIHAKIMRQVSTACPFDDLSPKERDGLLDRAEAAKKRLSSDESAPVMLIKYAGRPTVRENVTLLAPANSSRHLTYCSCSANTFLYKAVFSSSFVIWFPPS